MHISNPDTLNREQFEEFMNDASGSLDLMTPEQLHKVKKIYERISFLDKIEKARTCFRTFVELCGPSYLKFSSKGQHDEMARTFERVVDGDLKRVTISLPPRFGKKLTNDTPVLTTIGWKNHGDLTVGDFVFGRDGKPVEVIAVSDESLCDREVEFSDGSFIGCHEQHLWLVKNRGVNKDLVLETQKIESLGVAVEGVRGKRGFRARFNVDRNVRVEFTDKELPLDPYSLGVWLGDGTSKEPRFTHPYWDECIHDAVEANGHKRAARIVHNITGVITSRYPSWLKPLKQLNLISNKHIPEIYLLSSSEQRLKLLAGIIDTDGTMDKSERITISNTNEKIVSGVERLIRSLGWRCYTTRTEPSLSSSGIQGRLPVYQVGFNPDSPIPTIVPRKTAVRFDHVKRQRSIVGIRKIDPKPGKCIMVDGGIYLCGEKLVPTHNSEFGSICLPAWYIGKFPRNKIIQASAKDTIAADFGRKVKMIMDHPMYKLVFPGVSISKDSRASGKFATTRGGTYFAVGVNSGVAGLGADLLLADDIVNEQTAKGGNPEAYDSAWEWFLTGPQQRLQPGGRLIVIGTRWSKADPIGRIKRRMKEDPKADKYESIEFTALDENDESNFPEIWPTEELLNKRANTIPLYWNAQYMQDPTHAGGSIVPKDSWRPWKRYRKLGGGDVEFVPPECHFTMLVMDTAYTKNKRSNPTAITVWGCFDWEDPETGEEIPSMILLYSEKKKMDFGELKRQAKIWIQTWEPDATIIEEKSSGPMLRSELNQAGIMTIPCAPKPREDKVSRLNSVASMFSSGRIWYIPSYNNEACRDEVADFPQGDEDDWSDTVAYAIRHARRSGLVGDKEDVYKKERGIENGPPMRGSKY